MLILEALNIVCPSLHAVAKIPKIVEIVVFAKIN